MKKAQPRQTLNGHSIFSSENAQDAYYKGGGYMAPILPMHFNKGTQIFRDTTSLPFLEGGPLLTKLTPAEEKQFQKFYQSLPDNLQSDDDTYDIRGYWDSEGRPEAFDYSQPKEKDGYYHAYSINGNTGEYLKSPAHETFQHAVDIDRTMGYRPITNVQGRNIVVENESIKSPEETHFLNNTIGPMANTPQLDGEGKNLTYKNGGHMYSNGGQLYTYSGRPGATYQKVNGQWYIQTEHTNGKFIPVKDPTGKRTALLNAQAKPMASTTNKYQRTYDPLLDNAPQIGETAQKVAQDFMMAKNSEQYAKKSAEAQARAQAEKSPEQIANEVSASSLKNSLTPEEKALAKEYFNNPEYNYYHDPIRGVREGNVTDAQSFTERMDELVWPAFQPFTGNPSFEKTKLQEFEKNKVKKFQTLDDAMRAVYAERIANNRGQSDTRLTPSEEVQLRANMPTPGQMASGRAAPVDWLWATPIAGPAALEMLGAASALEIPGMYGATLGNAANAGFIGHGVYSLPNTAQAWNDAYKEGKGDYRDALEKTMWNTLDFAGLGEGAGLKSLAQDALQGTKAVKNAYNEVATGNSILPYAWKSPMKNMTAKNSENIFNNVLQSNKFTDAEKQIISEYANNSGPFTGRFGYVNEAKKAELQKVIDKAKVEFPNDIVLSRKINANNPDLFNLENNVLNIGNRPTSFSVGIGDTGSGFGSSAKDRIVLSGKNAKKIENNFLKNTYENPSQEYLQSLNPQEHPYGFLEAMNNRSLEKELIGSGFDLKKVGKVKNELGGHDYIMKPIKSKVPVKEDIKLLPDDVRSAELDMETFGIYKGKQKVGEVSGNRLSNGDFQTMDIGIDPQFQKQGIGTEVYKQLNQSLPEGNKVKSWGAFVENNGIAPGRNTWQSLERQGLAKQNEKGIYEMLPNAPLSSNETVKAGFDGNFITRPFTLFGKNELTSGNQWYRKIGNEAGLKDLIKKEGAQAPAPMRMKSGITLDAPFFGKGSAPNENYKGLYTVEVKPEAASNYNWRSRVAGVDNYGSVPFSNERLMQNVPLEDLNVYRKKWFSNNYKQLDPKNLEEGLKNAALQRNLENVYKWGIRGYLGKSAYDYVNRPTGQKP